MRTTNRKKVAFFTIGCQQPNEDFLNIVNLSEGKKNVDSLKKKVQALQRQLGELGPLMRGSVVKIGTRNKQYYFSLNKDKKTRLIYLGDKKVARARQYSKSYKKLVQIADKMSILNMELLKNSES